MTVLTTRTMPSATSDCGKVLYSLFKYGAQTRDELFKTSGCCGVGPRIFDLRKEYIWSIYTIMEPFTRPDGKVVDIARYHLDWSSVDMKDPAIIAFLATCKAFYN